MDGKKLQVSLTALSYSQLIEICGPLDSHLNLIEQTVGVHIHRKEAVFHLTGALSATEKAHKVLKGLESILLEGGSVDLEKVKSHLYQKNSHKRSRLFVTPANLSQKDYLNKIYHHDLTLGIGPAGTGKTHLAVAQAVSFYKQERVQKIILTRPAVEAGEQLGFLPGDMSQKVDPYLRPLFDSLNEFLGTQQVAALIEKQDIEVAPLAFMRGRTLKNAFVILDEAQNTTRMQMKMFLTRFGQDSKVVVTGDMSQVDLPRHRDSGLVHAVSLLRGIEGVAMHQFTSQDVMRHQLVAKILQAYENECVDG